MALHTKKFYYRRNNVTYSIDLYTTIAEVGSEYIVLMDGSTPVYAKIGDVGDANVSYIRCFKGGATKGILSTAVVVPTNIFDVSGTYSFVVPAGITSISAKLWGSGGAGFSGYYSYSAGGAGGFAGGTFPVTPGETLTLKVSNTPLYADWWNGGFGGGGNGVYWTNMGAGGGGASSIYRGSTAILVAGGGGGAGPGNLCGLGGAGGGSTGQDGTTVPARAGYVSYVGKGGSQTAGGAGGSSPYPGGAGSLGQGGNASGNNGIGGLGGGGGGGGYYGGGAGAGDTSYNFAGGGGGGSSYAAPSVTSPSLISGDGAVPGNSSDPDRGTAGNFLIANIANSPAIPGKIILDY